METVGARICLIVFLSLWERDWLLRFAVFVAATGRESKIIELFAEVVFVIVTVRAIVCSLSEEKEAKFVVLVTNTLRSYESCLQNTLSSP